MRVSGLGQKDDFARFHMVRERVSGSDAAAWIGPHAAIGRRDLLARPALDDRIAFLQGARPARATSLAAQRTRTITAARGKMTWTFCSTTRS